MTYSRCQMMLERDAPAELLHAFRDGYEALVTDLGLATVAERAARCQQIEDVLPYITAIAGAVIAANALITS